MPYPAPNIAKVSGRIISIAHPASDTGLPKTYLTASAAASAVTLSVADKGGFADENWVRIGEVGTDTCEIVMVNAVTARGQTMTVTALVFAHSAGEPVERVYFDQYKVYGNTTDTTVAATLIATVDQTPEEETTVYVNTGTEYAYYFVREYDSNAAADSDAYSDGVASTGYPENAAGRVVERALDETGTRGSGRITYGWCIDQINDCLGEIRESLKTWSFVQSFGYALGQTELGENSFTLPDSIHDPNSPKSILNVYLDGHTETLKYMDREEVIENYGDLVSGTVRTQATAGDLTLEVDDSYGFADSGSVTFWISGTEYSITYTGVTRSVTAGVLTGVPAAGSDGAITVTVPAGTAIRQNVEEGEPAGFAVSDGTLTIWPFPDSDHDGLNVRMDFYTDRTAIGSLGDTLEGETQDLALLWLKWKMRSALNALGLPDLTDSDYLRFRERLEKKVRREVSGQRRRLSPKINRITY